MSQQFQKNDLEALLNEYQEARHLLRNYPHILDAILNQITALQAKVPYRSRQEVKYEVNRTSTQRLIINPPLAFYVEPVCPECGTPLITDVADTDRLICP